MGLRDRLTAAVSAFMNKKVPQGKAVVLPYFYGGLNVQNRPVTNTRINAQMLRAFSETPIVRRAIDYIRNQITRLEWDIVPIGDTKLKREQRKKVETLKNVLKHPNPDDNWNVWLGQLIDDLLVIGQGASEIKEWKNNPDHPYILYPVDASSIQVYVDWSGDPNAPRYAQMDQRGNKIDFKPRELMFMRYNARTNTPFGLSPTEVACQQIQYFLDAQAYAGKTASNAVPKKLLDLGPEADSEKVREFEAYFQSQIVGTNKLPVVGGTSGAKTVDLGNVGDNSLFLHWQEFLIAIIANAFGLDLMKFNSIVGINRSTGDTLDDASDESAIRPLAELISHYINNNILPLFELDGYCEFQFRFTTSYQDRKSLAVIHQILLQADAITINEARREMGLPDLEEDKHLGKSKGDFTLSEYRALYGGNVTLQDAVGLDQDYGEPNPIAQELEDKAKQEQSNSSKDDPNNNGGNNGVYGSPKPKEKDVHKRNDKAMDVSL